MRPLRQVTGSASVVVTDSASIDRTRQLNAAAVISASSTSNALRVCLVDGSVLATVASTGNCNGIFVRKGVLNIVASSSSTGKVLGEDWGFVPIGSEIWTDATLGNEIWTNVSAATSGVWAGQ